ncbi:STY4851/ECs_5259 family protein [Acinetobacter bereziniae]|uniref:STY4851/ECs_5259 family protein n=1 Tax=Acinetobacter TaxID=469 RepID=UPI00137238BA|nr:MULTISPECIES: STY4851/ECs_5259 family protein [Acinetobacter]MCU4540050.1 STY4851/ECs_5259 family protein [Acinetobacter bereziniae]MCU4626099.1 STY4851/ECs_5259 family protein [Acinetobacter bereziniae]MDP6001624.1 STY4851/ECs_5259 family protein [Acinetobacter bereziniae]NAR75006.1 hypothetical protein [Acinetobacter haemolyticus]
MELLASDILGEQLSARYIIRRIFESRKLTEPTSHPLYTYHITLEEYQDLKSTLRSSQQDQKSHKPGREWCAVFTLFVSEWFRREYKSGWSWVPVYDALGFQPLNDIRYVVQQGLESFWKRPILKFEGSNHTNYLGSAFKEGGFPSNLLMEQGNHYQAVFKRIVAQFSHYRHYNHEINDQLIQAYTRYLPQAFKEHETRVLISDMAEHLVHLVETHQLDNTDNPAAYLSVNFPKWREAFPLPLESSVAEQFLNQLLLTSSTELKQMKTKQDALSCVSFFNRNSNQILTEIFLPNSLEITLEDVKGIPPRVEIVLYEAHEPLAKLGTATFMARPEADKLVNIRIGAQTRIITRKNYQHGLILALQNKDQIIYQKELPQTCLEIGSVPVAFAQNEGELCPFIGQASFKTAESEIILLLPPSYQFTSQDCVTGHLSNAFGQHVYKVKSDIGVIGDNQEQYHIQCSKYYDKSELVDLFGKKFPWSTVPVLAFLGRPNACYIETGLQSKNDSLAIYAEQKLLAHHVGSAGYGVKTLTVKNAAQNVVLRRKIVIFPEDLKVELLAGDTPNEADIRLLTKSNIICLGIIADHQAVSFKLRKLNNDIHGQYGYEYHLSCNEHPPENIKLNLMLNLGDQVDVLLPFPSHGATLYNGNHQPIKQKILTLDDLLGSRLCLYAPENKPTKFWMTIRLKSVHIRDVYAPYYKWPFLVSGKPHQESLIHYRPEIEELLALTKDLDARIILEVTGGKQPLNYEIKHYQTEFEIDEQGHYFLSGLNLSGSQVVDPVIMVLNQPEQAVLPLEPITTEGVETGKYKLPRLSNVGPCLIIPRDQKSIKFRPKFIAQQVSADSLSLESADTLHTAIRDYHPTFNSNSIADYLALMACDLQNSGWLYLYHLYSKYNHLPLVTFQVWKDLVRNPSCLTLAIWLLDFEHDIYKRFEREFDLVWELLPIEAWEKAISETFKLYVNQGIPESTAKTMLKARYIKLSQEISTLSISFQDYYFEERIQNIVPKPALDYLVNEIHLQNLLRYQSEGEMWPTWFQHELKIWFENNNLQVRPKVSLPQQASVILLPIYLAMKNLGLTSFVLEDKSNSLTNHKIRQLRDFDQSWFNSIFEITISYLLNSQAH